MSDQPPNDTRNDEWIFTLHTRNSKVQLRQRQPQGPNYDRCILPLARPPPNDDIDESEVEMTSFQQEGDAERSERVTLLNDRKLNSGDKDGISVSMRSGVTSETNFTSSPESMWTFQSPFWSLSSTQLLSVTYSPAWQAIPEYTTKLCCGCSGGCNSDYDVNRIRNNLSSIPRLCCWNTCGSWVTPPVDHIQEIFTVSDIAKIESSTDNSTKMVFIRGVGECHTIKVYLRPMSTQTIPSMSSEMRDPLEDHFRRMRENGRAVKQVLRSTTNLSTLHDIEEHDTDSQHDEDNYIGPIITFCVPTTQVDPPLMWKVWLPPIPEYPIAIQTISILDGHLRVPQLSPDDQRALRRNKLPSHQPSHIFINGFQSWSFSGSLLKGQIQPGSALPGTYSRAFNLGGSPPPAATTTVRTEDLNLCYSEGRTFRSHYQSDFFTCITSDGRPASIFSSERRFPYQQLDERGGPALLLGWLSQNEQFGVINVDSKLLRFQMHCSADGQLLVADDVTGPISTDWAYAQLIHPHSYDEEPMANYMHTVAAFSEVSPLLNGGLLTGWCSWYVYYQNISASQLRDNVAILAEMRDKVPTNVSVVDDGYMTAWGDWNSLKTKDFPDGLGTVSDEISSRGLRPGLWLAPFAADKTSDVANNYPDWVIRNDGGVAANSSHCGKFFYGLDATNPDVRAHVYETVRRAVYDWKFDVLKIDFLYAACLLGNGKYDLSISRAQAMRLALKTIRDAAGPDIFLIGCGCPIASGIGYVDAMRISADTGPTWYPALPLPWWDNGTLPALRSMVRNSMSRAPFGHRWWHNDPDCLMLGSHTSLTDDEVASAASVVAMTCGMLLLSDDLPTVSGDRLSIVSKIFPLTGATAAVLDLHSTNDGLPSLMRLWCTDKYNLFDSFNEEMDVLAREAFDHNAKATFFARKASFNPKPSKEDESNSSERLRSCIHVTKGLGTWTLVSLSNWSDKAAVVRIPPPALSPPPMTGWGNSKDTETFLGLDEGVESATCGYHVFSFWSSKYSWLASPKEVANDDPDHTVCRTLRPHQTELFHIKKVTPDKPQYLGSDFHFSCGAEVRMFHVMKNSVLIQLNTNYRRSGFIYVFVPRVNVETVVQVTVTNVRALWSVVGNTPSKAIVGRVIRIAISIHSDGRPHDGEVKVDF